jgi:hypothetical protein
MLNFFYTTNFLLVILTSVYAFFIYKKNRDINFIFIIYLLLSEVVTFKYSIIDKIIFLLLLIYIFTIRVKIKDIFLKLNILQKTFLLLFLIFFNVNIFNEIYNTHNYLLFIFSFFYSSLVLFFLFNIFLMKNKNNFSKTTLMQLILFILFLIGYLFFKKFFSLYYFDENINLMQGKTWFGSARLVSIITVLLLLSTINFLKNQSKCNFILLFLSLTISFFASSTLDSRSIFLCTLIFLILTFFYIKKLNLRIILFLSLIIGQIVPIINWNTDRYVRIKAYELSSIFTQQKKIDNSLIIEVLGKKISIENLSKICKKDNFSEECIYNVFKNYSNSLYFTEHFKHLLDLNVFVADEKKEYSSNVSRQAHYLAFYNYLKEEKLLRILIGNGFYSHKEKMSSYFHKSYNELNVHKYNFTMYKGSRIDNNQTYIFRTNSLISMTFDVGIFGVILLLIIFFSSLNQLFKDKNYLALFAALILLSLALIINISSSGMIFALVIMPNIFINRLQ